MDPSTYLSRAVDPFQLDQALQNSHLTFVDEELQRNLVAKQAHNSDLYKTQQQLQGNEKGDVLVLVSFPAFEPHHSCQKSEFDTARVILTRDQILATGSAKLEERLNSESHQRRAKRAAERAPVALPQGVTHILDLSPSVEEDDYTIALQLLSLTPGIKFWYRAAAFGASIEAVAGHDDVCRCKESYDTAYPIPTPPFSIEGSKPLDGLHVAAFLLDTETWPVDDHRDIDDFSQVRQGANVLRLFRSLANNDLQIDSAPRMWTLVGLFSMFNMTNYDLIRDHVVTWFNAGNNYLFVEVLPEETLRIASVIKAPVLAFAAFRILVNERALVIAGGHVRGEQARKNTTIFGRRSSGCLSGTEQTDFIMRMVEHAGVAMAERYRKAIDDLFDPNALGLLGVPEWNQLIMLGKVIPKTEGFTNRLLSTYNALLEKIRAIFLRAVTRCIDGVSSRELFRSPATRSRMDMCEIGLSYLVPKEQLATSQSFSTVYAGLNKYQRALCPLVWLELRDLAMIDFTGIGDAYDAAAAFSREFKNAKRNNIVFPGSYPEVFDEHDSGFYVDLFEHIIERVSNYAAKFGQRPDSEFGYNITQYLVLGLDEKEMDYFRFEDESLYEPEIPEAVLGPTGPGPSFHTGITVPSVSDSVAEGMDDLALRSDDGTSTVIGSVVVQDGISTVFGRNRVLTPSETLASERFTDEAASADFAEAEFVLPAAHQPQARAVAQYVEGSQDGTDDSLPDGGLTDDESDLSILDGDDDDEEDDMEIITHDDADAAGQRAQDGRDGR
ncbi:hypothetical protein N8I77_000476 [Diaporthe amygdali]|uniref:Uncharacterized protein n=1 Tax=Phomopsis amygdali TaxID=1214568 RepID=A0AAD9SPU8_PHOAM|nr:hypothetical protein N8I77_000476 [Diaporthe amygdali]